MTLSKYDKSLEDWYFIQGESFSSNIYLRSGGDYVFFIDSGGPGTKLFELPGVDLKGKNIAVLLTHGHWDHTAGLLDLISRGVDIDIYVHRDDVEFYIPALREISYIDISSKKRLHIFGEPYEVINTPGHTPGSTCIIYKNNIFTGDTVFRDGWFGRTDFPGGNSRELIRSIDRLRALDVDNLLPGHMTPVFKEAKRHLELSYINAKSLL
jgi:glyoxylase-like metal-dependent hydrolase (beta-lactamase superfamily II)